MNFDLVEFWNETQRVDDVPGSALEDCAVWCLGYQECKYISYNPDNERKECALIKDASTPRP